MKKLILITIAMLLLQGCQPKLRVYSEINIRGSEAAAQFIVECAKAANPMADEEGEDLVEECTNTAKEVYGTETFYAWTSRTRLCAGSDTYDTAYKCAVKVVGYEDD